MDESSMTVEQLERLQGDVMSLNDFFHLNPGGIISNSAAQDGFSFRITKGYSPHVTMPDGSPRPRSFVEGKAVNRGLVDSSDLDTLAHGLSLKEFERLSTPSMKILASLNQNISDLRSTLHRPKKGNTDDSSLVAGSQGGNL